MIETSFLAKKFSRGGARAFFRRRVLTAFVFPIAAVLVVTATTSPLASADPPAVDITGQWRASDIQCPVGNKNFELLTVVQLAQQVLAVKVSGDACVPAGYKFFQGTVTGNFGPVTCFGGTPLNPLSSSSQGSIFVVDANTIKVCDVTLVRTAPLQPAVPSVATPTQTVMTPSQTVVNQSSVPAMRTQPARANLLKIPAKVAPTGPSKAAREAEVRDVFTQVKTQYASGGAAAGVIAGHEVYGSRNAGSFKDERLGQFKAGYEYVVSVACDNLCGEISLELYDGSSTLIGSNSGKKPIGSSSTSIKAMPWTQLEVAPNIDQQYSARVKITSCLTNPCEYGLLVSSMALSSTNAARAVVNPTPTQAAPNDRVKHVRQFIDTLLLEAQQNGGTVMYRSDGTQTLANGAEFDVPLGTLQTGRWYRFEGTCDLACSNLNLNLWNGVEFVGGAASDNDIDKEPYIEFQAAAGRQYWVRVTMASCGTNPCNWGLVGASR